MCNAGHSLVEFCMNVHKNIVRTLFLAITEPTNFESPPILIQIYCLNVIPDVLNRFQYVQYVQYVRFFVNKISHTKTIFTVKILFGGKKNNPIALKNVVTMVEN